MTVMQLVEQHLICRGDPRFATIDKAAFASKSLYKQATYQIRQAYIHEGKYLPYAEIYHRVKHLDCLVKRFRRHLPTGTQPINRQSKTRVRCERAFCFSSDPERTRTSGLQIRNL